MKSVADLFDLLDGPTAVARILGVGPSTASEMKRRGSIPAEYWVALINEGQRRNRPEITADALAKIHARPTDRRRQPARASV